MSLSFRLLLFSKASLKCLSMNSENISPQIFQNYCYHKITLLLKDITTIKCTILPPLPVWLPFTVQSVLNLHFVVAKSYFWLTWLHQNGYLVCLTNCSPVLLFYTRWKHQKTFRFSDVFRGYRKATLGCDGLKQGGRICYQCIVSV